MRTRPVRSSLSTGGARRPRPTSTPRGVDDEDTFHGEFLVEEYVYTYRERERERVEARGINPAERSRAADVLYNRNRDFIQEGVSGTPLNHHREGSREGGQRMFQEGCLMLDKFIPTSWEGKGLEWYLGFKNGRGV